MIDEAKLFALVKTAIELAIVRQELVREDELIDEEDVQEIVQDTWNALRGVGTCAGEPTKAWVDFMKEGP